MKLTSFLTLASLAVSAAFAQNVQIGYPTPNTTIAANQNITVQVEQPVRILRISYVTWTEAKIKRTLAGHHSESSAHFYCNRVSVVSKYSLPHPIRATRQCCLHGSLQPPVPSASNDARHTAGELHRASAKFPIWLRGATCRGRIHTRWCELQFCSAFAFSRRSMLTRDSFFRRDRPQRLSMRKCPSQCSDVGLPTVLCMEVVGRAGFDAAASGGDSSGSFVYGPSS